MDGNGASGDVRRTWTLEEVRGLHALPFSDLMHRAQSVHRRHFDPNAVQVSTLLSIKTGACPEDCAYCPQSIRYDTGLERESLMDAGEVVARARAAREAGATRFCMGAAWRSPKDRDLDKVADDGRGRRRPRPRDLRHARHADARAGEAAQGRRPRLLQPQPRHLRGLLRRGHHDAHLPGPPRHARRRARRRHPRLLRRHPRHGRDSRTIGSRSCTRSRRSTRTRRACRSTSSCRSRARRSRARAALDPIEFVRIVALARILMPRSHVRLSAGRAKP